jgi:ribosomal protein S18 acetylase RimI-like enzyme
VVTDEVRIRLATRGEWERLRDLRLRSLGDAPDAFGSTLDFERRHGQAAWVGWIEGWEGAKNALFVAERGPEWIGMAVGSRAGDEPDAHLYGMWVDPAWRARGIGARLVDEVLGWAGSWGARSVILSVTETNAGATAFYERLGFVDTGDRHRLREESELTVRVMSRAP